MKLSTWIRSWKRSIERRWALHQALRRKAASRRLATRLRLEALEDRWLLSAYVVTSADDSGTGSLRDAINSANNTASGITEIDFNIGPKGTSSGVQTISPATALPALTENGVFINGYSENQWQGVASTSPLIELNGTNAGSNSDGLLLQGSNCTVSGLFIENFTNNGIEVDGANDIIGGTTTGAGNVVSGNTNDGIRIGSVSGVQVQGNFVGTNTAGSAALANSVGVEVAGSNDTIGGTTSGARNVISGNSADGVLIDRGATGVAVQGNYIGTDITGTQALGNQNGVVINSFNDTVGGTAAGARNIISGNATGIEISVADLGGSNQIEGNYIGTDVTGTQAVGNTMGVVISLSSNNVVGGTADGAGNLISGNRQDGVDLEGLGGGSTFGNSILGNKIGTDVTGRLALGNGGSGIEIRSATDTQVGGDSPEARNLISANQTGIFCYLDWGTTIAGNYIGTDVAGTQALGNGTGVHVLYIQTFTTIGGSDPGAGNLISGNEGDGIFGEGGGSSSLRALIQGNKIGTDATGTQRLGNAQGVDLASLPTEVADNLISGNIGAGIYSFNGSGNVSGHVIRGNRIGTDITGTKSLGNGTYGVEILNGFGNTVGGSAPGAGNVISGNAEAGIYISGADYGGNQVQGNYIGTNAAGNAALANNVGIEVADSNNTIGGTTSGARNIISGNSADGVLIDNGASGVLVQGNYIGTDVTGANAVANGTYGIDVEGSGNTIGGTTPSAGNIISGNSQEGVLIDSGASGVAVQGNYIGTDVTGSKAIANTIGVVVLASNNTIGGTTTAARNIISGNRYDGVIILASGVSVLGNYIGTDVTGANAVGNNYGVEVEVGSSNNTIGGTTSGARNIISGNSRDGVLIDNGVSGVAVQGNYIGTDVTGANAVGNAYGGVVVNGNDTTIGGTTNGARNIISGNSTYGVLLSNSVALVQGNYIGTDATGTKALANSVGVAIGTSDVTIGGTTTDARNIISGNDRQGVDLSFTSSDVQVQGNYIGTDVTGAKAIANSHGVDAGGIDNTIGGTAAGAGNIISGNSGVGVFAGGESVQVQGNYIGTDATGTNALANGIGVLGGSSNITIGGTTTGARNIISGNGLGVVLTAPDVTVQGNYIGTDISGSAALGNSIGIQVIGFGSLNTIGGTISGARNIISGNRGAGVLLASSGVAVQGNYIGTNAAGSAALANSIGIMDSVANDTIGGTSTAARNIISGNSSSGVLVSGSAASVQGNYIGTDATGTTAVANAVGIEVNGVNGTIGGTATGAGNVISSNTNDGVLIDSYASGVAVQGNYIGTNADGSAALANSVGIEVASSNNTIGGTVSGARNIISGNSAEGVLIDSGASGVLVQGNYIGTDITGAKAVANSIGVEVSGSNNTIGGTDSGAGNLISGNRGDGILLSNGSDNVAEGNFIGTDVTGTQALGNLGNAGVELREETGDTLGGTVAGSGNLISGNQNDGVKSFDSTAIVMEGNFIGTDVTGTKALGNRGSSGVELRSDTNDTIGGTTSGTRNLISGNPGFGITDTFGSLLIEGNYIGTDITGTKALGNGGYGLEMDAENTTIGGTVTGAGNLISGNGSTAIYMFGGQRNVLQGNIIGTDVTGTQPLGNGGGLFLGGQSNDLIGGTTSGAGNLISANRSDGIDLVTGMNILVEGNTIGADITGAKALGNAGNGVELEGFVDSQFGSVITIGGTTVAARNLISGNQGDGVLIGQQSWGNLIEGNYIGTDVSGDLALGNAANGVEINQCTNDTVGGTAVGAGNLISGNGQNGVLIARSPNVGSAAADVLQGNLIGTNSAGTAAVGNGANGVDLQDEQLFGVMVGGAAAGAGNVISGNTADGVQVAGSFGVNIQGNFIGTDQTGSHALGNGGNGVNVSNSSNTTIGGTAAGAGNLISGNAEAGIYINGASASGNQVQGNYIGTDVTGANALGNSIGVSIASSDNTIGGTSAGARNVISGNRAGYGVAIDNGASGVAVQGNYIGTDAAGKVALANDVGVEIGGSGNTVGGMVPAASNIISGNSTEGVRIYGGGSGNQVLGNSIGTNVLGTALGNGGYGVSIAGSDNTIGGSVASAGNTIAYNNNGGVLVQTGSGDTIRLNSIFANGSTHTGPGITLSSGANNNIAAPALHDARLHGSTLTVQGSFTAATAHVSYILDFFANGAGDAEGKIYLGSLTVTPKRTGNIPFAFTTTTTVTGTYPLITATLTDASGDTSSFSNGVTVSSPPSSPPSPPLPVLNVPPLLAFFNILFGGTETMNSNGTETVTDSLFGIPLLVSTYNSSGNLMSVTLLGINLTLLFE